MENKILVETSARHVHVTQETLEVLFGAGHQLEVRKMLSQPGQFASTDKVTVIGYNKKDPNGPRPSAALSILGPVRDRNWPAQKETGQADVDELPGCTDPGIPQQGQFEDRSCDGSVIQNRKAFFVHASSQPQCYRNASM